MGGFRRRMRRQAREAAKQLMKQGVPANTIGRVVDDERIKRALMRVIDGMEKKLDGTESNITVREGLAAINTILKINNAQAKAIDQGSEIEELEAALEEDAARQAESKADHQKWLKDVVAKSFQWEKPATPEAGITSAKEAPTPAAG